MAEKTLTLIGQMDKVWMNAIEEFDDGAPGCEIDLHVRLVAMEGVLRFVKAQRPKTSEQIRVAVIAHLREMEKELLRQKADVDGYDEWFRRIAREFASGRGVVTDEDMDSAADAIREIVGLEKFPHRILKRIVQVGLKTVGIRSAQETIEGVYHSEDAFGTDRIETDSRPYFLDISPEYDGKRIAVHIEVLED